MGYEASWGGCLTIKKDFADRREEIENALGAITEFTKEDPERVMYPSFDGRYYDDDWHEFLDKYAECFEPESSIEFAGEDNTEWRFRILDKPNENKWYAEENGHTVYEGDQIYAVFVSDSYVRDAQYCTDPENEDIDDAWHDAFGSLYVGVYRGHTMQEAIEKASADTGYPEEILGAINAAEVAQ